MAIVSCPKCGKQISDKAIVCPNCGTGFAQSEQTGNVNPAQYQPASPVNQSAPKNNNKPIVIIGVIIAVLLVALIAVLLLNMSNGSSTESGAQSGVVVNPPSTSQSASNYTPPVQSTAAAETESTAPAAPTYYNVTLTVDCIQNTVANKYGVDVLVDGMALSTVPHGGLMEFSLQLSEGSHSIEFRINGEKITGGPIYDKFDDDTFKVMTLFVDKDMSASYSVKLAVSNSIKVTQN